MSNYFQLITIFEITLVRAAPSKVIRDPVKIEFFSGPRSFRIPVQVASIVPKGTDSPISRDTILTLPDGAKYLSITARTKETDPVIARKYCETLLDRAITDLSVLYGTGLFAKLIYRGWLIEEKHFMMEAWVSVREAFEIPEKVESILIALSKQQNTDVDISQRYATMSRFFSRSIVVSPSEEKLLYLWTILEIYPMKDTTDIKPISRYLSDRIGRLPAEIKDKLGIGRMFGIRSDLVHNGVLTLNISEMGEFFGRLEGICLEVLRGMSGVDYDGSLDKYFL